MNVMLVAMALLAPVLANAQEIEQVALDGALATPQESVERVQPIFDEVDLQPVVQKQEPKARIEDAARIEELEASLARQEETIEKLSLHLESALKRLNYRKSEIQTPSKVSSIMAAKDRAQKKADNLQQQCDVLKTELSALRKEKQLLDLENRQLFHALNGVERSGRAASKSVYSKENNSRSEHVVAYPSY